MQASKRVALNTGILYGRMILTMAVSLYSTRLVLNALGSKDYGIFNLIAGVIAMLSFLNAAMTTSTQRFISYHQGKQDLAIQKKIFTNSLLLHIIIGLIIVAGLEIIGLFFFNGFLKIPADKIEIAKLLYHFMSATVFFTIIAVPFTASLNAHEKMGWLAIVSIIEVLLKLSVAILISGAFFSSKLLLYGILTECISMFSFLLYLTICVTRFKECSVKFWHGIERPLMKQLSSFAGWNLFGALCGLGKTQGLAIILNIFFGTVVNAAYGIANQISGQLNFLSSTILQAINPQIMKSQGANDTERMLKLSMIASRFSFFLMAMVCIPCIFEMRSLLTFWLKNVPDNTVVFSRLILTSVLINQLTIGLQSAIQATGKIKAYQATVGSLLLFNLPISYLILRLGLPAYAAIASFSALELIACCFRLYFANRIASLKISDYITKVFAKELIPTLVCIGFCFLFVHFFTFKLRFICTGLLSTTFFIISIYFAGLYNNEKDMISKAFQSFAGKFPGKKAAFN